MTQQTEQDEQPSSTGPTVATKTIGLREVASRIGIDYETARRWAADNRLPVFKFNGVGRWRAYPSDIDAYVSKHKNKAASWEGGDAL
jgi:excisionase family DNA binding protein